MYCFDSLLPSARLESCLTNSPFSATNDVSKKIYDSVGFKITFKVLFVSWYALRLDQSTSIEILLQRIHITQCNPDITQRTRCITQQTNLIQTYCFFTVIYKCRLMNACIIALKKYSKKRRNANICVVILTHPFYFLQHKKYSTNSLLK